MSEFPSWMDACLEELLPVRVLEVLFQMHRMTFRYSADENTYIYHPELSCVLCCVCETCVLHKGTPVAFQKSYVNPEHYL